MGEGGLHKKSFSGCIFVWRYQVSGEACVFLQLVRAGESPPPKPPVCYNLRPVVKQARLLIVTLLSLLLFTATVAQGFWLCESGKVCHTCDDCGFVTDDCGQKTDCSDCCSLADLSPSVNRKEVCDASCIACTSIAVLMLVASTRVDDLPLRSPIDGPAQRENVSALPRLHGLRAPPARV